MTEGLKHILYKFPDRSQKDLIPILQEIQNEKSYITEDNIKIVSQHIGIPEVKIYSIATFYNQFRFTENAKYHIRICKGSACHVLGNEKIFNSITSKLDIQANNRSKNGLYSIEEVSCLGACALAPLIEINGEYHPKLTQKKLENILNLLKDNED